MSTSLAEAIRNARVASGHSQEALARLVGVRAVTISRWERGVALPRLSHLERLAVVVSVDLRVFLDAAGVDLDG